MKSIMPENSYIKAEEELKLILDQKQINLSPIFGEVLTNSNITTLQDYTQFTPRSHYNKNSILNQNNIFKLP